MSPSYETAILAGGCFWAMQDLLRRYPGSSRPESDIPAGMSPTRPIAITVPMPRRSRLFLNREADLSQAARVLLSDS